jgi:nucleotide-binding universal stress UspA family protein
VPAYRTVIAGVHGSATGARAVEAAGRLAAETEAELVLVAAHDSGTPEPGTEPYTALGPAAARESLAWAEARCAALGARRTRTAAVKGDPAEVLTKAGRDLGADLLLIGSVGLNSLNGRLLGSVPDSVAHGAGCDVFVVHTTDDQVRKVFSSRFRRRHRTDGRTVVVGVQDTGRSRQAADRAAALAADTGADLVLVGAYEPAHRDDRMYAEMMLKHEAFLANERYSIESALRDAESRAESRGVRKVERMLVKGDLAYELLRVADKRRANLVVVDNQRARNRTDKLIGSTSDQVARHTSSHVLLVH